MCFRGDLRQLSEFCHGAWTGDPCLKRVLRLVRAHALPLQYRSVPCIGEMVSCMFYDQLLQHAGGNFPAANVCCPFVMVLIKCLDQQRSDEKPYPFAFEADLADGLYHTLQLSKQAGQI